MTLKKIRFSSVFIQKFVSFSLVLGFALVSFSTHASAWPTRKKAKAQQESAAVAQSSSTEVLSEGKVESQPKIVELPKVFATETTQVAALPSTNIVNLQKAIVLPPKIPTIVTPIKANYGTTLPKTYVQPYSNSVASALESVKTVQAIKKEQERQKKEKERLAKEAEARAKAAQES